MVERETTAVLVRKDARPVVAREQRPAARRPVSPRAAQKNNIKDTLVNSAKAIHQKIEHLKKNINRLEKDLNTMGSGVARLRRKMSMWSTHEEVNNG